MRYFVLLLLIPMRAHSDCKVEPKFYAGSVSVHNRVDPSGRNMIVRTGLHSTAILKIPTRGTEMLAVDAPFDYEPIGVEISEKLFLILSPDWDEGAKFFDFSAVLKKDPKSLLFDDDFSRGYQSFGKLSGDENNFTIRVFNRPTFYRDISVRRDGEKISVTKSAVRLACPEFYSNPQDWKDVDDWRKNGKRAVDKMQVRETFSGFPIIAPDGRKFAAVTGNPQTTKIYEIQEEGSCKVVKDLGFPTSKVSFGYTEGPTKNWIAFSAIDSSGALRVYVYNLTTGETYPLREDRATSGQSGGNFSKDGRLFVRSWEFSGPKGTYVYSLNQIKSCPQAKPRGGKK